MGKTTRLHPISLNVIRGAADTGGFKFARIRQTALSGDGEKAMYEAQVVGVPVALVNCSLVTILGELRKCFLDDIIIDSLRGDTNGNLFAIFRTSLNAGVNNE